MTHRSNPAEEIQSAIDKLERLKSLGSDGKWRFHESSGVAAITNEVGRGVAHHVPLWDAALIATLHATIDTQGEVLRGALDRRRFEERRSVWSDTRLDGIDDGALALARAINGGA